VNDRIRLMATQNYTPNDDGRRVLKIILWVIAGLLILSVLCCIGTLGAAWFLGDWFVEMLRAG
jgi:hypothetical protein